MILTIPTIDFFWGAWQSVRIWCRPCEPWRPKSSGRTPWIFSLRSGRRWAEACDSPGNGVWHDRWCPRSSSRVQLVQISTITFGLMNGGYIYSYWDYQPTYNWGGTTLHDLYDPVGYKTWWYERPPLKYPFVPCLVHVAMWQLRSPIWPGPSTPGMVNQEREDEVLGDPWRKENKFLQNQENIDNVDDVSRCHLQDLRWTGQIGLWYHSNEW